jgi:gas vesicle protein
MADQVTGANVFILGLGVGVLLGQVAALVYARRLLADTRDAAVRAGMARVRAKQEADRAEKAAGVIAWPERKS